VSVGGNGVKVRMDNSTKRYMKFIGNNMSVLRTLLRIGSPSAFDPHLVMRTLNVETCRKY
jgi:hypothetical protein